MDIVEFLEARITEEEHALSHADDGSRTSLAGRMRAECAQKRAILTRWREYASTPSSRTPCETDFGMPPVGMAMLAILAAGYLEHDDFPAASPFGGGIPRAAI